MTARFTLSLLLVLALVSACRADPNNSADGGFDANGDSGHSIEETGQPDVGTITVLIRSTFTDEDTEPHILLPDGLEVRVFDGNDVPVADADVQVYPMGQHPTPMAHTGDGRYQVDVLSSAMPPDSEYFFEVRSEFLTPERSVVRVEHRYLETRPEIESPVDGAEHPSDQSLTVQWAAVQSADCYTLSTREHALENWTVISDCNEETTAEIGASTLKPTIRVLALASSGDEAFESSFYYSLSRSESFIEITLTEP